MILLALFKYNLYYGNQETASFIYLFFYNQAWFYLNTQMFSGLSS